MVVANRAPEILDNSTKDQWRQLKGIENPAGIGTREKFPERQNEFIWLNRLVWLQKDEESWSTPWCQENNFQLEQAISGVATETQGKQLLARIQNSIFNRKEAFDAHRMTFKKKQKWHLKADEIQQANFLLIYSNRKLFECFKVNKKQQNNIEIIEYCEIFTLCRKYKKNWVEPQLKRSNLDFNAKHPILLTAKRPVVKHLFEKKHICQPKA